MGKKVVKASLALRRFWRALRKMTTNKKIGRLTLNKLKHKRNEIQYFTFHCISDYFHGLQQ